MKKFVHWLAYDFGYGAGQFVATVIEVFGSQKMKDRFHKWLDKP